VDVRFIRRTVPRLGGPTAVYIVVFVLLLVLFSAAGTVTRRADEMRDRVAAQHYQNGLQEESRGRIAEAERRFRAALAVSRDHPPYRLALARVLLAQKRRGEAENHLKELVRDDPTSGMLNLLLARVRRGAGDYDQAARHYQRAIYGYWPEAASEERIATRTELIEMFHVQKAWNRMLPELLQLREDLPAGSPGRKKVARWFLDAGSPQEALRVWERLRDERRNDPEVHLGLADARFRMGDYRNAYAAYRDALHLDGNSAFAKDGVRLTESILSLDPTARMLRPAERLRRARRLTEAVIGDAAGCATMTEFQEARRLLEESRNAARPTPEEWIERAENLWRLRNARCPSPILTTPALPYVFRVLETGS
jgi:tetratricopeptide (TPR) repeat protein